MSNIGQKLASVPFGEMIISLGMGIAEAQVELDRASAEVARMMSGVDEADRVQFGGQNLSLIELGFTPTFYQFIESTIEVKMVVNMRSSSAREVDVKTKSTTTSISAYNWWRGEAKVRAVSQTVDAKYTSQYDYSVEGSSLVRTKLVPVPPPSILEERIRLLMEQEEEARDQARLEEELPDIRKQLVDDKAIENFSLPSNAKVFSVRDIQIYFLEARPEFQAIFEDLPAISQDTAISAAFDARHTAYLSQLTTRLNEASSAWNPAPAGIYGSLGDIQAEFLDQHPDLADELSANPNLLEAVAIQSRFRNKFTNYQDALTTSLNSLINALPMTVGQGYLSAQDVLDRAITSGSLLESQLRQNPKLLDDGRSGAAKTQFEAYKAAIGTDLTNKLATFQADENEVYRDISDLQAAFLSTHVDLANDLESDPTLMQNLVDGLTPKYSTYRTGIATTLDTEFAAFSVPEGALPISAQALLNLFLSTKPALSEKLEAYPNFLEDASFQAKVNSKFTLYKGQLKNEINLKLRSNNADIGWFPPLDQGLKTATDVRDLFFDTHPNLNIRVAGLAAIEEDLDFSKRENYVLIMEDLKTWEPTAAQLADTSKTLEEHFFDTVVANGRDHNGIKTSIQNLATFKQRFVELKAAPQQ